MSASPTRGLFPLVLFDLAAILAVTALQVYKVIPLRMGAFAYIGLFLVNIIAARRFIRRHPPSTGVDRASAVPKSLWFAAIVFTTAGLLAVVAWFRRPDLPSTVQALAAVLLVTYIWVLVHKLRRKKLRDTGFD